MSDAKTEPMSAADFGTWVAAARARHGWDYAEVARRLGCSLRTVGYWRERGAPGHVALACAEVARAAEMERG